MHDVKWHPYLKVVLEDHLDYNPDTGCLFWKRDMNRTAKKGDRAGSVVSTGYRIIGIQGEHYQEHRIVWLFETGMWPTSEIDHIDRDKENNRFSNLREVTRALNNRNTKKRKDNTSGYVGVSYIPRLGKYQASVFADRKRTYLGLSLTAEGASELRRIYLKNHPELGFTERHGT